MNQRRNTNADVSTNAKRANAKRANAKRANAKRANANKKIKKKKIKYEPFPCPCGGGQSCIVHRRIVGDWVHEDNVFRKVNLPIRKDCYTALSQEQLKAMKPYYSQ